MIAILRNFCTYSELYGKEIRYCSDRKEEKDHGADKGSFLGSKLKDGDRVVMIEDVTTSGKSMEETVPKVKGAADVEIVGYRFGYDITLASEHSIAKKLSDNWQNEWAKIFQLTSSNIGSHDNNRIFKIYHSAITVS